jgi:hypothetical protein
MTTTTTTKHGDTTMEDEETAADVKDMEADAATDADTMAHSKHGSTAGRMETASTAAPNASPIRKATLTTRPMQIGRTAATTTVTLAADGGGQSLTTKQEATFLEHAAVPSKKYLNHAAIVNTGATGHYLDNAAEQYCITDVEHTNTGP